MSEIVFDPSLSRAFFEESVSEFETIEEMGVALFNGLRASMHALSTYAAIKKNAWLLGKISELGSNFSTDELEVLKRRAWALWHIINKREESETGGNAQISLELLHGAEQTRKRMLRVLFYIFGEDPKVAPALEAIVRGAGYLDMVRDLDRLADLYQEHSEALAGDGIHYRAEDEAQARELAKSILIEINGTRDQDAWRQLEAGGRYFLLESYEEIRAAVNYVARHKAHLQLDSMYATTRGESKPSPNKANEN